MGNTHQAKKKSSEKQKKSGKNLKTHKTGKRKENNKIRTTK